MSRWFFGRCGEALGKAAWAVALMLALTGCAVTQERGEAEEPDRGQFTLFLNGPDKVSVDVALKVDAINVVAEDGSALGVVVSPVEINSVEMAGRQKLLGETYLPEGKYRKLQLVVSEATVTRAGRKANLSLPPEGIELAINVSVERGQNTTLFLIWDADASVAEGYRFHPAFAARGERPELASLLVFVTNEGSGNVSVINRQLGEVVATVKAERRPRGIAVGLLLDHPRVYVANSGSNSISVIDPATNRAEASIPVRFGNAPEGIAVARVSEDSELIFVANYASNSVSVVDPLTYEEIENVRVGNGPVAVAADPPSENFQVSQFLDAQDIELLRSFRERFFNVYVANSISRDVSVLKVNRQSRKVEDVATIGVDWNPIALSVDAVRGRLYVANYDSDKLSIISIPQVIRNNLSGAVSTISDLDTTGTGVIADPSLDRLYFLVRDTERIALIRLTPEFLAPGRLTLTPVVGSIAVGASPRSMAMDPEGRKIYVVNRGSDSVSVIDKTTGRRESVVPVGRNPYGVAMFPEM
ncbi:MAG: hypothetical protein Kow0025_07370 [Thermodesulfovibrionales bacterium]